MEKKSSKKVFNILLTIVQRESTLHTPVMYDEILAYIGITETRTNIIVDATLGLGGHAAGIIRILRDGDIFVGIDRDSENLTRARAYIEQTAGDVITQKHIQTHFVHADFRDISGVLDRLGIDHATGIYYDLGVSSVHFDQGDRGFSFRDAGAVDMRYDRTTGRSAYDIIHTYERSDLIRVFRQYGDEPKANYIADAIVQRRAIQPIETTAELSEIIEKSSYDPKSRVRVFQALRIETNDEYGSIEASLQSAIGRLDVWGRCLVITFHSGEDRLVKQVLGEYLTAIQDDITGQIKVPATLSKITKKPLLPAPAEIETNPRARSAKMRIVAKSFIS